MKVAKCFCVLLICFVLNHTKLFAFDSIASRPIKLPKHYFNTTIYGNFYIPTQRTLDTVNKVSERLKSYKISQLTLGFTTPIYTKDYYNKDSTRIKNLHFLLTGGLTNLYLNFGGISEHTLSKTYLGFRGLYNNGKRSIFFVEVAPFITQDRGYRTTRTLRLSTTLLYNCSVNDRFSFRIGFTRSFLYGNLFNLPYVGVRIGRLDKVNLSLQFPRSVTLSIPAGKYISTSLYAKPQGGFYTFSNNDSIALGSIYDHKTMYFGRTEFLLGTRIDVIPSKHINFYLSGGLTTGNNIQFFPTSGKANMINRYDKNYKQKIKNGLFVDFGVVIKFGKTKSIYNNLQMYNAVDMNNSNSSGDNNLQHTNTELLKSNVKLGKSKTDDVIDLIDAQDLY